jgi:EAL domain-containing protein (putative c-di-GMP-specific phosphodiesterase class I)
MKETSLVFNVDFIDRLSSRINGQTYGVFKGCRLSSAYQPIFSLAHKRIVGYEALVRAEDHQRKTIRADVLFRQEICISDIVLLDRLCRYIHINNFQAFGDKINWLFLNVSPQTIIHGKEFGSFFHATLEKFNLPSYQVVIEIVEYPILGEENFHLIKTVEHYKELGCLIAIDDFGSGHSNFDRIWTLKPDIVKLDRSMLLRAAASENVRQLFPGIVSLLHQAGALVIIEGIETEDQAVIAMESDADMVQGYFFSKPHYDLSQLSVVKPPFKSLFDSYKISEALRGQDSKDTHNHYLRRFQTAVDLLQSGRSMADSCKPLFKNDSIIRAFLLEPCGLQIGDTIVSPFYSGSVDYRFKPLEEAKNADWFRRHYLKRAVMNPGTLQITRPYLSITGAHMCSTLSMMIHTQSSDVILCCDLKL